MKYYLYNPKANNGKKPEFLNGVDYIDATITDYKEFFGKLKPEDEVVMVGGDGTLNYLVNHIDCEKIKNKIYFKAAGTGNDFLHDIEGKYGEEILVNDYLKNLPTVKVNGITAKFINGIGYGIDGYCCEVADKQKAAGHTGDINYTAIALKGLLFFFKRKTAHIDIDGKHYDVKRTWLCPSMKGRFYGGGMMVAPGQDRKKEMLSVVTYSTISKLVALAIFPSIFKGQHIKHTKLCHVWTGKTIKVSFDVPCALQIDGETVLNVKEYEVSY